MTKDCGDAAGNGALVVAAQLFFLAWRRVADTQQSQPMHATRLLRSDKQSDGQTVKQDSEEVV